MGTHGLERASYYNFEQERASSYNFCTSFYEIIATHIKKHTVSHNTAFVSFPFDLGEQDSGGCMRTREGRR